MAKAGGPSVAPLLTNPSGSRVVTSPERSQVSVPPGWMSARGAVDAVVVTLAMPPVGALVTPLLTVVICVSEFFLVVAVLALSVDVVLDTPTTDDAVPTVVVVSAASVVSVPDASVDAVVALEVVAFLLPPPHAAAISPHAVIATTAA